MTLKEIIGAGGISLLVLMALIEISPIKLNPWKWIFRAIGRAINGELYEKIDNTDGKIDGMQLAMDENEIDRIRWEILDFANSCRNGRRHTKEEFDHIINMHQKYIAILKRRGRTNGQVDLAYRYIEELYMRCQLEGDFL